MIGSNVVLSFVVGGVEVVFGLDVGLGVAVVGFIVELYQTLSNLTLISFILKRVDCEFTLGVKNIYYAWQYVVFLIFMSKNAK